MIKVEFENKHGQMLLNSADIFVFNRKGGEGKWFTNLSTDGAGRARGHTLRNSRHTNDQMKSASNIEINDRC